MDSLHLEPIYYGSRLRRLRLKSGRRQKDLAILLNTTSQNVSQIEDGHYLPGHAQRKTLESIFPELEQPVYLNDTMLTEEMNPEVLLRLLESAIAQRDEAIASFQQVKSLFKDR